MRGRVIDEAKGIFGRPLSDGCLARNVIAGTFVAIPLAMGHARTFVAAKYELFDRLLARRYVREFKMKLKR